MWHASWMSTHPQIEGAANYSERAARAPLADGTESGIRYRHGRDAPWLSRQDACVDRRRRWPSRTSATRPAEDDQDDHREERRSAPGSARTRRAPWPAAARRARRGRTGRSAAGLVRPGRSTTSRSSRAVGEQLGLDADASPRGSGSRARWSAGRTTIGSRWAASAAASAVGAPVLDHRRERRRQRPCPAAAGACGRRRLGRRSASIGATIAVADTRPRAARRQSSRSATRSGRRVEVRRQRLVEDPEQAALEVHRQPPVRAHRVELDRDAGPPAAVARRAPQRRHEPEVVEDHRPDVEDERLRRVERLLDHRDELADLAARPSPGRWASRRSTIWAWRTMFVRLWAGPSCIARAISRRRSSWAARTSRDTAGRRRRVGAGLAAAARPPASPAAPPATAAPSASAYAARRVAEAGERLALALEDVDLGLHQRRPLGERDELAVRGRRVRRSRVASGWPRASPPPGRASASWRAASDASPG